MKRRRDLIQLSILAVLGLGVLLALILPELPSIQPQYETVEISLFLREGEMSITSNTRLGMEEAALNFGAELRFVTPPTQETHENQLALIQREVEGGADLLIISPIDPTALGQEEISTSFFTIESQVEGASLFASPDNSQIGDQLAQAILADNHQGLVLLVNSADTRTGVTERIEQCKAILLEAGLPVLTCTQSTLTEPDMDFSQVVAIVAADYQTTLSLSSWAASQTIHHCLYGVGGTTEIAAYLERGTLQATVTWSEYALGYLTVQRAVEEATGVLDASFSIPTITTIRGETIYDPDNQKLLFPVV